MSSPATSASSSLTDAHSCVSSRAPDRIQALELDLVIGGDNQDRNCLICNTEVPFWGYTSYGDTPGDTFLTNFLHCDGKLIRVHRTCHALAVMFSQEEQKSEARQMAGELREEIQTYLDLSQSRITKMPGEDFNNLFRNHGAIKSVNSEVCSSCPGIVWWNSPFRRCMQCLAETYPRLLQGMSMDQIRAAIVLPKQASFEGIDYAATVKRIEDNYYERTRDKIWRTCNNGSMYVCTCIDQSENYSNLNCQYTQAVRHEAYIIRRNLYQAELASEEVLIPDLANLVLSWLEKPTMNFE